MSAVIKNRLSRVSIMLAALISGYQTAQAQSLTLTSPTTAVTVRDGDDFATSLANPWDCNQTRDIALEYGTAPATSAGGIWSATSRGGDYYYFFPLSPGFLRDASYVPYASWYDNGTPYGVLNPLNANKYKRISIRMSMAQSARSLFTIYWTKHYNTWPAAQANGLNFQDVEPTFTSGGQYTTVKHASGFMIYDLDMTTANWFEERVSTLGTPCNTMNGGWDGLIYGFQVWPTTQTGGGSQVQVDWARAYDPDTSPRVNITWTTSGIASDGRNSIQIFLDKNNTGFDGDLFKTAVANDGSFSLRTACLPPGDYYVYLKAIRHQNSGFTVLATSGYSGLIRIGDPPILTFTAPSFVSGDDYATTDLGNPWDMSDSADISSMAMINSPSFSGGQFTGITAPPSGALESDDQIHLNNKKNGSTVPVNTKKYRYFTYRMRVDPNPAYVTTFDRVARGWESRIFWWNSSVGSDGSFTKDVPIFDDWHSYTVDLWDNAALEVASASAGVPQYGWEELPQVTRVRFDPMEAHESTRFWIDDIKLCAENYLGNGQYQIQWNVVDGDSSVVTVKLYYGTFNASGVFQAGSASPFATVTHAPGQGSYLWNVGTSLSGSQYLRADVTDGSRTNSYYSKVPIRMIDGGGPSSTTVPVWGDYDGDGIDDQAVYEKSTGKWFIRSLATSNTLAYGLSWGDASMDPVPGDYNGDGIFDLAVYQRSSGYWFIRNVAEDSSGPILYAENWGSSGMDPVPGDFDGDSVFDLAVYERSSGKWFIRTVAGGQSPIAYGLSYGHPLLKPVAGDYNGDGTWDLGLLYAPRGVWFAQSIAGESLAYMDWWGDSSMTPVVGDFNGDGKHDFAMYQRSTGNWYIRNVQDGLPPIADGTTWGNSNRDPILGDYDADGASDLSVYDRTSALWHARPVNSTTPILNGSRWGYDP